MFNSIALQVCMGLIFIFLLYSLLATVLQEIVSRWIGLRARILMKGLRRMLEDGDSNLNATFLNYFIDLLHSIVLYFRPMKNGSFLKAFYAYPLIKYLGENNWSSKPSYIRAEQFSDAIIHLLRGSAFNNNVSQMALIRDNLTTNKMEGFSINEHTLHYVRQLWTDAGSDIEKFRSNLEAWFNGTMERATGWYKRQTQFILLLIGFTLAVTFNVDTIAITRILSQNENIRKDLITLAEKRYESYGKMLDTLKGRTGRIPSSVPNGRDTVVKYVLASDTSLAGAVQSLNSDADAAQKILGLGHCNNRSDTTCSIYQSSKWYVVALGWLLTAIAISFGAPFWFDILSKIMTLRAAGTRPEETASAKSNDKTTQKRVG